MKHRSATPSVTPDGFIPGSTLDRRAGGDIAVRFASSSYNAETRTIQAVASTGARVRRWGIYEELAISAEAVDLGRVAPGQVKLLDSHDQGSIDRILGSVTRAWIDAGTLMVEIRFADTEAGREAEARATGPDAPGLSVGYRVTTWTLTQVENDSEIWRADRWELLEVSLVAVPADPAAMFRAAPSGTSATPPETLETDDMRRNAQPADAPVATPITTEPAAAAPAPSEIVRSAPATQPDAGAAATRRAIDIMDIGQRAGMDATAIRSAVDNPAMTVEAFRAAAFDALAGRQPPASHVRVERDETETRMLAMREALTHRLAPASAQRAEPSAAARSYMDLALVEMAAERLGERRVPMGFGGREDIIRRAFHTTSDFPVLFEGALNSALAARYMLARPTYRRIARQRSYADFRDHTTIRVGDFPALQPVNPEGGEIKAGTFSESKEKTAVKAYGVRVDFSRAMLVNDTLNGLVQVLNDRGNAVARFEDATFYAMMLSGANADGPTLLETTRQVFNTTDASKASANAAITVASVALGRAALRKRKSKDGSELEISSAIILVGPDKELEAQQLVAPIQAQQAGNVNPFSGSLAVEVTAKLTGNSWYLFADPSEVPCFEWGLLEGYTAPRFRIDNPFGVQGTSMTLEHDFGCGAIDFRGGYKNAGA